MKVHAAVLEEFGAPLEVHELDLAEPRAGEVLVRLRRLPHRPLHGVGGRSVDRARQDRPGRPARPEFFVDPAKVMRWMGIDVELDPKSGGIYRANVISGNTARAEFVEVDRPHRLLHVAAARCRSRRGS